MSLLQIHNYSTQYLQNLGLNGENIAQIQASGKAELQIDDAAHQYAIQFIGSDNNLHEVQITQPSQEQFDALQVYINPPSSDKSVYGSQFSAFDIYQLFAILIEISQSDKKIATQNILANSQEIKSLAEKTAQLIKDEASKNLAGATASLAGTTIQSGLQIAGSVGQISENSQALNSIRVNNATTASPATNINSQDAEIDATTTAALPAPSTPTTPSADAESPAPATTATTQTLEETTSTQNTQVAAKENAEVDQKLQDNKKVNLEKSQQKVVREIAEDSQAQNTHTQQVQEQQAIERAENSANVNGQQQITAEDLVAQMANENPNQPFLETKDQKMHQLIQINKFRTELASGRAQLMSGIGSIFKALGDGIKGGLEFSGAEDRANKELVNAQKELNSANNEVQKQAYQSQNELIHQIMDTMKKIMEAESQAERKVLS